MNLQEDYLISLLFECKRYKSLGDKTFIQLDDSDIHWKYDSSGNSIAVLVKHLSGNMLSRWTNFLTEDGEKNGETGTQNLKPPTKQKRKCLLHGKQVGIAFLMQLNK